MTLFIISFSGCSKSIEQKNKEVDIEKSVLLQNLSQINNQLSEELCTSSKANGRGAMIAIADLGGAYTGGKLGAGAYSSWHESQNTKAIFDNFDFDSYIALCDKALHDEDISGIPIEMREKIFVDEKIVKKTDLSSESKRVGKMHNIVLASLQEGVVIETGQHEIKNDTEDYESAILYSDQMKELLLSYASGNYQTEISLSDSVLKLFNNIFEECARNSDDVSIIINKYQSIIETSNELNEDEKYNLSLAFATALYSINYWSE